MNFNNIYIRVKQLIISPSKEWTNIAEQQIDEKGILLNYLTPIFIIASVIEMIFLLTGTNSFSLAYCISKSIFSLCVLYACYYFTYYITVEVLKHLNFKNEKITYFKLVSYASTGCYLGIIVSVMFEGSFFGFWGFLGIIYSGYLIYLGLDKLLHVTEEKRASITVINLIALITCYYIFDFIGDVILSGILQESMYNV